MSTRAAQVAALALTAALLTAPGCRRAPVPVPPPPAPEPDTCLVAGDLSACELLCTSGHAAACTHLAAAGGPEDAAARLERACDARSAPACRVLAELSGELPARPLVAKACGLGDSAACAALYERLLATPEADTDAALIRPLRLACRGHPAACVDLAQRYLAGRGVEPNPARAASLLAGACRKDFAEACTARAELFWEGGGTRRDSEQARALFTRACSLGDRRGCERAAVVTP